MHSLHPGLAHFPIAFLSLSYALDLAHSFALSAPKLTLQYLPRDIALSDLPRAAHYLRALGLVAAVPTILTGALELLGMLNRGWTETVPGAGPGQKRIRPKVKVALLHASLNYVVMGFTGWLWWQERAQKTFDVRVLADGYGLQAVGVLFPLLFGAAYLGGLLTYEYGVGLRAGNVAAGKKRA